MRGPARAALRCAQRHRSCAATILFLNWQYRTINVDTIGVGGRKRHHGFTDGYRRRPSDGRNPQTDVAPGGQPGALHGPELQGRRCTVSSRFSRSRTTPCAARSRSPRARTVRTCRSSRRSRSGRDRMPDGAVPGGALVRRVVESARPIVVPRISREPALAERRRGRRRAVVRLRAAVAEPPRRRRAVHRAAVQVGPQLRAHRRSSSASSPR